MKVLFPKKAGGLPRKSMFERYYRVYYGYVLAALKYLNADLEFGLESSIGDGKFLIQINGEEVVIDYSDHLTLAPQFEQYPLYFKFHYSEGYHEQYKNLFPFSPISFYDWKQYYELKEQIQYTARGDFILNRQHPHGNALGRRRNVQNMLKSTYGDLALTSKIEQQEFWKEINKALVSVCVPGSRNNMLDRGHMQYLAFGACTISPKIITKLPGFKKLIPDMHYLPCKDDYSDLIQRIEWCKSNRNTCLEIGRNAQALFLETSTPGQLWKSVKQQIYERTNQHIDSSI